MISRDKGFVALKEVWILGIPKIWGDHFVQRFIIDWFSIDELLLILKIEAQNRLDQLNDRCTY